MAQDPWAAKSRSAGQDVPCPACGCNFGIKWLRTGVLAATFEYQIHAVAQQFQHNTFRPNLAAHLEHLRGELRGVVTQSRHAIRPQAVGIGNQVIGGQGYTPAPGKTRGTAPAYPENINEPSALPCRVLRFIWGP